MDFTTAQIKLSNTNPDKNLKLASSDFELFSVVEYRDFAKSLESPEFSRILQTWMKGKKEVRVGYACLNTVLRRKHIFCSRTARQATIEERKIAYARELFDQNLDDLLVILKWNESHGIRVFRMSSEMAPHSTNPRFIPKSRLGDPRTLAYSFEPFQAKLRAIGEYARTHGHRLTFHPGQYTVVGAQTDELFIRSARELYMHALILDMMGLDANSIIIVHGGGVYCDKVGTMRRWARNFAKLPINVKRRLVLENDETCYSTEDVLAISKMLPKFPGAGPVYRIPVLFDIFHYECYDLTIARHNEIAACSDCARDRPQKSITALMPEIIRSWGNRRVKMHLSTQGRGVMGKHSYLIKTLPTWVLSFPRKYGRGMDLMLEAKGKEQALFDLRRAHPGKLK